MTKSKIIPVILCGGSGTRLWPASREQHPKQFLSLTNDHSLLQNTATRALKICGADISSLVTVALGAMKDNVLEQLASIDPKNQSHLLCEPSARNTAAAIAFAADYVRETFGEDAILWVLPADHHIGDENALAQSFQHALPAAMENNLVTFGITPTRPDTGYGYIRVGDAQSKSVFAVRQFIEKPDAATAGSYLNNGDYLWNSGMFLFSAKTVLEDFKTHAPIILNGVREAVKNSPTSPLAAAYNQIPLQPFDKAIMEKSTRVCVVPCDPQWSDIGSWQSLWDIHEKDANGNALEGNAIVHNAHGCLVQAKGKLVVLCGVDNLVAIETDDVVFIADKSDSESLKNLIKILKESGHADIVNDEVTQNKIIKRESR